MNAGIGGSIGAGPSDDDMRSLEQVTHGLGPQSNWSRWVEASPVVVSFHESLEVTDVERALEADIASLQAVCHAPRMLLRHEDEREPVSRVRRLSPKSVADLVARPADWEHRTLRGIRPARALSVVVEDDLDLYENQVVARLLERLDRYLTRRLRRLTEVCDLLAEGNNFSDETRGSHWRARRLATVWERVEHDDTHRERAASLRKRVSRLRDGVRALLGSPLYRGVPRGARVEDALRPTNIFVNDRAYRRVAALWRLVTTAAAAEREASRHRGGRDDRFCAFAMLLTIQALASLGYAPDDTGATLGGGPIRLEGSRGELTLTVGADGAVSLWSEGASLTVVAWPARVTEADAGRMCAALRRAKGHESLVLLLGRPDDLSGMAGVQKDDLRTLAGWSSPRALLVSPWSLDATERVARVLGAWDAGARLARFPPHEAWPGDETGPLPAWIRRAQTSLAVARPPSAEERARFEEALERRLAVNASRFGRGMEREHQTARRLRALLDRAASLRWLARCPVCDRSGARFEDRWQEEKPAAQQVLWCICDACGASWGLHACGDCGGRHAVLDPGVKLACPDDVTLLDRTYGRDLWAEARAEAGRRAWRGGSCVRTAG